MATPAPTKKDSKTRTKLTAEELMNRAKFPTPVATFVVDYVEETVNATTHNFPYDNRKEAFPFRVVKPRGAMSIEQTAASAANSAATAFTQSACMGDKLVAKLDAMTAKQNNFANDVKAFREDLNASTTKAQQMLHELHSIMAFAVWALNVTKAVDSNELIDTEMGDDTA